MVFSAEYWHETKRKTKRKFWVIVLPVLIVGALLVSPLCGKCAYWFLPGNREVTAQALEAFAENLKTGEGFSHAAVVFCQQILDGE